MLRSPESKGIMSPREAISTFIRAAILALAVMPTCNGDNNNDPDAGPDTGTDPVADCSGVDLTVPPFSKIPAVKCFCPGDGDQTVEITEQEILEKFDDQDTIDDLLRLVGTRMQIQEGTFDECAIAAIARANFPADATAVDEDGAVVDADNPDNKILSEDGVEVLAISASDPYNPESTSGFNELELNKDAELEFPAWYGTVMKWVKDDKHFETVNPTTIDADGAKYSTNTFSAYGILNGPFDEFTSNSGSGDQNGFDVNEDGVLFQINVKDENQEALAASMLEVSDGTNTYELIPTGTPGQYRVPIFEGQHDLIFIVTDRNGQVEYRHVAEVEKSIDLDVDLCEDVDCPDDGDVCNGYEDCDPSDGECESFDPLTCDNGDVCDGDETCDPIVGCEAGTPLNCDNNDVCDGLETCDSVTGCQSGTPLTCDDGLACTGAEICDSITGCDNPPDVDCGVHGSCTEPLGDCSCTDGYTGSVCEIPPNNPPVISSLGASPNPVGQYGPTSITFDINDSDGDNIDWEITLSDVAGYDGSLSTSDGTCDTWRHCYGTVLGGSGSPLITFNTGWPNNFIATVDADDNNGGTDNTDTAINVQ